MLKSDLHNFAVYTKIDQLLVNGVLLNHFLLADVPPRPAHLVKRLQRELMGGGGNIQSSTLGQKHVAPQIDSTFHEQLNAEIHRGREFTAQFKSIFDMSDFICKIRNTMDGYENVQMVLRTAQEFLVVLKSLHRQLGTRTVSLRPAALYTQGNQGPYNRHAIISCVIITFSLTGC